MVDNKNDYTIYHNPRCKKSREALALLHDYGIDPTIILYLKDVPTSAELRKLLARLHLSAEEIVRTEEPEFKARLRGKQFNEDEWITILRENPKLIQRPIVVKGNRAIIGRPTENVKELLK